MVKTTATMSKSSKIKRLILIFQTCFDGTSVIVSVTVMKISDEFYSAQVTMHTLHYIALCHMDSKLQRKCQINVFGLLIEAFEHVLMNSIAVFLVCSF